MMAFFLFLFFVFVIYLFNSRMQFNSNRRKFKFKRFSSWIFYFSQKYVEKKTWKSNCQFRWLWSTVNFYVGYWFKKRKCFSFNHWFKEQIFYWLHKKGKFLEHFLVLARVISFFGNDEYFLRCSDTKWKHTKMVRNLQVANIMYANL